MNTRVREQKDQDVQGVANRLPQTSWTLLAAAQGEGDDAVAAHAEFARRYYPPVHAYIAAIVRDPVEAEELTQGFFTNIVATGLLLKGVDQTKGSFRPYLKQALRNYLIDEERRRKRKKRRAPEPELRPDADSGGWEAVVADVSLAPDAAFHNAWVQALLKEALAEVQKTCEKKGQQAHLELFLGYYLSESPEPPSWEELGGRRGLSGKAARTRAEAVARHFRLVLRRMLATDVRSENVDEEIAALLEPL